MIDVEDITKRAAIETAYRLHLNRPINCHLSHLNKPVKSRLEEHHLNISIQQETRPPVSRIIATTGSPTWLQNISKIKPQSIMAATNNLPTLSLEAAKIASEAAQEKAKEMGIGMWWLHQQCIEPNPSTKKEKKRKETPYLFPDPRILLKPFITIKPHTK
jgi:NCAIR mutase (PurE)-related protein